MRKLALLLCLIFLPVFAFAGGMNNPSSGGGGAGVSSFTGDGSLISNSASTGAVTTTLANAGAYTVWGNNTSSSAAPGYQTSIDVSGTITGSTLTSTVSTGTAPLVVSSTTNVANLNASSLGGATFAAPGAIGSGTPSSGAFTTLTTSSTITVTSSSANSLAVGPSGSTTPIFNIDSSTSSAVAGIDIIGAVTGGTVKLETTDSGSNNNLDIEAKGTGTIAIGGTSTGNITIGNNSGGTQTINGGTVTLKYDGSTIFSLMNSGRSAAFTVAAENTSSAIHYSFATPTGDTAMNASTAVPTMSVGNSSIPTRTWSTGTLADGYENIIYGAIHAFAGASTQTQGETLELTQSDCGANGTCSQLSVIDIPTRAYTGTVTNGYAIYASAPSAATHNYAAYFGGMVGIGTASPSAEFAVGTSSQFTVDTSGNLTTSGSVTFSGLTNADTGDYVCYNAGVIEYDATACLASLGKYKENIAPLSGSLSELMKLQPVSYTYKKEFRPKDRWTHIGFIAEDVEKIDKRLAAYKYSGELESVNYNHITVLNTEAIKEMQQEISASNGAFPFHKCFFDLLVCPN